MPPSTNSNPCAPDKIVESDTVLKRYFLDVPDNKAHLLIASEKGRDSCLGDPRSYREVDDGSGTEWSIISRHDKAAWTGPVDAPADCG